MTIFPPLPLAGWRHTRDSIQTYTNIIGSVCQVVEPPGKYGWQTGLRVAAAGLTTTPLPAKGFVFELMLDFVAHQLRIYSSKGNHRAVALQGQSAELFCTQLIDGLAVLGVAPDIDHMAFADETPGMYDETAVSAMWQAFTQIDMVFKQFQRSLPGAVSPVQLWPQPFALGLEWRTGQQWPDQANEQMTFGFSTGDAIIDNPYFYAMATPSPRTLTERPLPDPAYWQTDKFTAAILLYEDVQTAVDPNAKLIEFLQATHEAGRKTMT
ncbi:MAG: hypothetical protein KDE56_18480 [Anaerolineales bacterium]|nr:hypothetical protein [Anaerolineales bacterium]